MLPFRADEAHMSGGESITQNYTSRAAEDIAEHVSNDALESSIPVHPLGVKPLGNQYFASGGNARRNIGVFQILPDEALMLLLEQFDARTLRVLGYTCKFLFAFCSSDDLWKTLFLESHEENPRPFEWFGSWRSSLLGLIKDKNTKVDCSTVFSDVLHRPFVCSHVPLARYAAGIPKQNQIRKFPDLTYDDFADKWSSTPFVLTDVVPAWPVYNQWTLDSLLSKYSDVSFRAEAVDWPFSTYHQYMLDTKDESPLYLFDKRFAEKMKLTIGRQDGAAYWKPDCFGPDLFELLGSDRPAHRWLIIGPERSGSTFHKDPNATSAWNAVIQGSKYWIMFPPSVHVPGVYVSEDNSEVTSPLSIAEWLLEFHAEARMIPECVEGVCNAGEVLHVPSGWWHLVVNLEAGIALTQNFVPKSHLSDALSFLRDRPDQVTGFKREIKYPYELFRGGLEQKHPELLEKSLEELEQRAQRKRKWDAAVGPQGEAEEDGGGGGFTFGFGGGDDDDIP
ncbi:hypothetical protein MCOR25_005670 [Pyricularia grisea]|uniref:Uncharacterized protein n=1 Tax=Pyricularia grisea TaxID=148305 RepID=A0A6P8B8Q9_PYRGI|nr:uncharacterized protein PgNI_03079 [Pyricularia grisea]KAI6364332.1 hypothetical protein MCOR25_005670 [Pyricularia grisea]TLD12208.1 hypothetical protein PgNI_03079 [Pyricularia grisea]